MLASRGYTDVEIGQHLGIAVNTVSTHWKRLFAKVRVTSRVHAVAIYLTQQNRKEVRLLQNKVEMLEGAILANRVAGGRRAIDRYPIGSVTQE